MIVVLCLVCLISKHNIQSKEKVTMDCPNIGEIKFSPISLNAIEEIRSKRAYANALTVALGNGVIVISLLAMVWLRRLMRFMTQTLKR